MRIVIKATKGVIASIEAQEFKALFEQYGKVFNVYHNNSNVAVLMNDENAGNSAISALHNTEFKSCTISVQLDPRSTLDKGSGAPGSKNFRHNKNNSTHGTKLTIFNVPLNIDESTLESHFSQYGGIISCFVCQKNDNRDKINAYLQVDPKAAEQIIENTDRTTFQGNEIFVAYTRLRKKGLEEAGVDSTIIVKNLPTHAKDNILKMRFSSFGLVKELRMTFSHRDHKQGEANIVMDKFAADEACQIMKFTPFYGRRIECFSVDDPASQGGNQFSGGASQFGTFGGQMAPNFMANMQNMGSMPNYSNMNNSLNMQNQMMQSQQLGPAMGPPMGQMIANSASSSNGAMNPVSVNPGGFKSAASSINAATSGNPLTICPKSQQEVDELIKKREIIEKTHPYEEELINEFPDGSVDMPKTVPPSSYFHLLRDRAITKIQLAKAVEAGFNVYGGEKKNDAAENLNCKYGFSTPGGKRPRW